MLQTCDLCISIHNLSERSRRFSGPSFVSTLVARLNPRETTMGVEPGLGGCVLGGALPVEWASACALSGADQRGARKAVMHRNTTGRAFFGSGAFLWGSLAAAAVAVGCG